MRRVMLPAAAILAISAPAVAGPVTYRVTIANMAFGSPPASLRLGDTIEWVNADIFEHTATAKDGSFDVILPPQGKARVVLRKAGKVSFYCRYHPGMVGTLTISP
jgi:plastocyanin